MEKERKSSVIKNICRRCRRCRRCRCCWRMVNGSGESAVSISPPDCLDGNVVRCISYKPYKTNFSSHKLKTGTEASQKSWQRHSHGILHPQFHLVLAQKTVQFASHYCFWKFFAFYVCRTLDSGATAAKSESNTVTYSSNNLVCSCLHLSAFSSCAHLVGMLWREIEMALVFSSFILFGVVW